MPPFGTCFQSKVGPGYALQGATHGTVRRAICWTRFAAVWTAPRSFAPMGASGCRYFVRLEATWPKWRQQ